jgi:ornithine cyclodeaminase
VRSLPYLDAATVRGALSWPDIVAALERALRSGLQLDSAPARTAVQVAHGELLLMPAETPQALGVKILGVAPDNPGRGLPRVQAVYLLLDPSTLAPVAVLDGTALTELRTAGVSALAVTRLASDDARRLLVFGTGPQARAHISALCAVRPIESVRVVGRDPGRVDALCSELAGDDAQVRPGAATDVRDADIVVCATTARRPLFDGATVSASACVVAVGSHEPDARELDETVFARAARVAVEHRATALREAGDVIIAVHSGAIRADALVELADVVGLSPPGGLAVFKSVGMGWQDLAVSDAIWAAR